MRRLCGPRLQVTAGFAISSGLCSWRKNDAFLEVGNIEIRPLVYFKRCQWLMTIEACSSIAFSSSGLTAILILCLRALFMHPTANDAVLYHFQLFFFPSPSFPHSPSPLSTAPKWESELKEDIVLPLPIPHLAFASNHLELHICCPQPIISALLQYDLSNVQLKEHSLPLYT